MCLDTDPTENTLLGSYRLRHPLQLCESAVGNLIVLAGGNTLKAVEDSKKGEKN